MDLSYSEPLVTQSWTINVQTSALQSNYKSALCLPSLFGSTQVPTLLGIIDNHLWWSSDCIGSLVLWIFWSQCLSSTRGTRQRRGLPRSLRTWALRRPRCGSSWSQITSTGSTGKFLSFTISPRMASSNNHISLRSPSLRPKDFILEVRVVVYQKTPFLTVLLLISKEAYCSAYFFTSDVVNRLNHLRGLGVANMFAWSSKRYIN